MYYKVFTKFGHVRRNKYILKWIYLKADNASEAAKKAKFTSRVKHHHKDAIKEVVKIDLKEYQNGLKIMSEDMYFRVHNQKDQKLYNCVKQEEIYPENEKIKYKKERNGQRLRCLVKEKEMEKEIQGGYNYD